MIKAYKKRAWLYQKYCIDGLNVEQIANICGVSVQTIYTHLERFGIK